MSRSACPVCGDAIPAERVTAWSVFCARDGLVQHDGMPVAYDAAAARRELAQVADTLAFLWDQSGFDLVDRYAARWVERAVASRKRLLGPDLHLLLLFERDVERWWMGRECELLTSERYVGTCARCPLWDAIGGADDDRPWDEIHGRFSRAIYDDTYAALGFRSTYELDAHKCSRVELWR